MAVLVVGVTACRENSPEQSSGRDTAPVTTTSVTETTAATEPVTDTAADTPSLSDPQPEVETAAETAGNVAYRLIITYTNMDSAKGRPSKTFSQIT